MKHPVVTILLILLIFTGPAASGKEYKKIRIAIGEWPPYMSEKLRHYGAGSRVIKEAFNSQGIDVAFEFHPWKRTLVLVKTSAVDAAGLWGYSGRRAAYSDYSDPVMADSVYFHHLKSIEFKWEKIEDLAGLKVGGTLGYNYGEAFNKARSHRVFHYDEIPEDIQNIRKLLNRRIDIFPFENTSMSMVLKHSFSPEQSAMIIHHPKPLLTHSYYLLFSKKNPENKKYLDCFNRGLARLRMEKKIQTYIKEAIETGYSE